MTIVSRPTSVQSLLGGSIEMPVRACGHEPAVEANPWVGADWEASWRRTTVSEEQWRKLRDDLRRHVGLWQKHVAVRTDWSDIAAAGALSSAAHTAYHLGAIRQILAALEQ